MPAGDFYTPTETDDLRLENELLAYENRYLKARLAGAERVPNATERKLAEALEQRRVAERKLADMVRQQRAERREARQAARGMVRIPKGRKRELDRAEADLKLLLNRMSKSKLRWLLQTREGFRALERRYL